MSTVPLGRVDLKDALSSPILMLAAPADSSSVGTILCEPGLGALRQKFLEGCSLGQQPGQAAKMIPPMRAQDETECFESEC